MTIRSLRGRTELGLRLDQLVSQPEPEVSATPERKVFMEPESNQIEGAYPASWDQVAEIRVFRATTDEWERLITWRGDMKRKGWKLLRVNTRGTEITAVFGRTRTDMKPDEAV